MEVGIKETKEIIKALEEIAVAVKKVAKDGKLEVSDITHLIELSQNADVILDGIKDADKALEEMKNLDQAEVLEIISDLYQATKAINEA